MNEALQQVQVHGLQMLEDGILGVITGTKKLRDAFHEMAAAILQDLLKLAIEKYVIGSIANALGMGSGTPVAPAPAPRGGPVLSGRAYLVGEKGPEIFTPVERRQHHRQRQPHERARSGGNPMPGADLSQRFPRRRRAAVAGIRARLDRMDAELPARRGRHLHRRPRPLHHQEIATVKAPLTMPARSVGRQRFELQRQDYAAPEASGRIGGVQAGFPLWSGVWTLAEMRPEKSDEWRAFLAQIRGATRRFYGRDLKRPYPKPRTRAGLPGLTRAGGGAFDGSAAAWSETITTDGDSDSDAHQPARRVRAQPSAIISGSGGRRPRPAWPG
jgi:hypothetical protein